MQPHYDWQKGKDAWEDIEISGQEKGPIQDLPLQRRWSYLVAVILIIGLIGGLVFWFVDRRARNNTAAVEADILRTNSLIFQAVATGDLELLRSNLSGRDIPWQLGVESAVEAGLFNDRSFWGLETETALPDESEIEIELSPEWDSAELVVPIGYETTEDGETIILEQTLLYRRSSEKWLLAPPDIGFWGERLLFEGQFLRLNYPERDQETVNRLAIDLDEFIGEICEQMTDVGCPDDFQVTFRLEDDLQNVATISSLNNRLPCAGNGFELPTPTLIGIPTTEEGYKAIFDGYRRVVVASAVSRMIYTDFCPDSPLTVAMLDYRLSQMGFLPWPLTPTDYFDLLREQLHLKQTNYYINLPNFNNRIVAPRRDERPVYALVEFFVEVHETNIHDMEKDIVDNPGEIYFYLVPFERWTLGVYETNKALELAWEQFLVEKSKGGEPVKPRLPDQDLRLVCQSGDSVLPDAAVYGLDLENEVWTVGFPLEHVNGFLMSVDGDDGVVVVERRQSSVFSDTGIYYWAEDEPTLLMESPDDLLAVSFLDAVGREGEFMIYNRRAREYGIISLPNCLTGESCEVSSLLGFPLWSPSGERNLIIIPSGSYGLEQNFARPFIVEQISGDVAGDGKSQFWMSDERFGYIAEDGRTVMARRIDEDGNFEASEVLFTLEEIDPLLALEGLAAIESVVSSPNEPLDLIVTVRDGENWASIYQVNILRRWIQPLKAQAFMMNPSGVPSFESGLVYTYGFSPDSHWLVISGNDLTTSTAYLHLFDLEENEAHSFDYRMVFERPMHWEIAWSAGDEWLALPDNGYIRLINPAADYQEVVVPDSFACSGAVWVD